MSWPIMPLRRVFRIVNGGTPTSAPENWDGKVPWATPVDLARVNGRVLGDTQRTLTDVGLCSGSKAVPSGSLIVSTRAPIGYVAQTQRTTAFNQGCRGLIPVETVDVRYFRYQLLTIADQLQSQGQGSTFLELSGDSIAAAPMSIPPKSAQSAIVDFLDAVTARVDALIAKKRRMVQLLDERRASIMRDACSGSLSSGGTRVKAQLLWLDSRPAHWDEALLRLAARLGSGHTPSREHPEWWVDSTIPWITTGEVAQMRADRIECIHDTREMISELGLANSSAELHPAGTVVLCRTASAGYSAIMGREMATSQDFATWTCGPRLRPRFLLLCLRAMRGDLLGRLAMGSTHKTIYMPDIRSIRIPLPPVKEQDEIVAAAWERLHPCEEAADQLARQIDLLREHRQALITAAVTGEMDVPGVVV